MELKQARIAWSIIAPVFRQFVLGNFAVRTCDIDHRLIQRCLPRFRLCHLDSVGPNNLPGIADDKTQLDAIGCVIQNRRFEKILRLVCSVRILVEYTHLIEFLERSDKIAMGHCDCAVGGGADDTLSLFHNHRRIGNRRCRNAFSFL